MDTWRIALLGDPGVGKTALSVQFTLDYFVETYDPTIEEVHRRQLVVDNRMCCIEVLDASGSEDHAILRDQWTDEGHGFILAFSVTSRASLERLEIFRQSMIRVKCGHPIVIVVGTQCDRVHERQVSTEQGVAMARAFGCQYIETSSKTGENVQQLFMSIVRSLRSTQRLGPGRRYSVRKGWR